MNTNTHLNEDAAVIAAKRSAFTAGLRQLADFLDKQPDFPLPYCSGFNVGVETKAEMKRAVKALGTCDKAFTDYSVTATKKIGTFDIAATINREQVCERVVTGKKIVPASFYPEHEEDVVEWKCPEGGSLLSALDEPEPELAAVLD